MSDPWETDWKRLRGALLRVRQAVRVRGAEDLAREGAALRAVAADEVFATLTTEVVGEQRGQLVVTYVARLVHRTLDEYADQSDRAGIAVLQDWLRIVTEGVTTRQLAAETTPPGAKQHNKAEQRIEYRLWLGGSRPSPTSRAAIHALYTTVTGGLHAQLDPAGHALDGASVVWEWDGLAQRNNRPARALLSLLAFAAPNQPLWISTLTVGSGPLPSLLRPLVRQPPQLRPVLTDLVQRGLLTHHRAQTETITVTSAVQTVLRSRLSPPEQKEAASALLRSITVGLPAASHDHATWDEWAAWLPHVLALIEHCERLNIRAGDCAYLLDRAAVGDLHHEHIESILGLANTLASAGRRAEARTRYQQALDQARRAHTETPQPAHCSMLAEVLNDYASELLEIKPPQPAWHDDAEAAATLLDEARRLLRPGDHGWHQTAINRALAYRRLGDTSEAVHMLRDTIAYCDTTFGHYSYPTFGPPPRSSTSTRTPTILATRTSRTRRTTLTTTSPHPHRADRPQLGRTPPLTLREPAGIDDRSGNRRPCGDGLREPRDENSPPGGDPGRSWPLVARPEDLSPRRRMIQTTCLWRPAGSR